jgi:hypothetical protein
MPDRIRLLASAAILLALLTACTTSGSTSSEASCTARLTFNSQAYAGSSLRTHPPYTRVARIDVAHMHVLGNGVIPACLDTNHSTDQDLSVRVARIDGVDPAIAIASYPDGAVFVHGLTIQVINKVLKSARGIRWDYSS